LICVSHVNILSFPTIVRHFKPNAQRLALPAGGWDETTPF
jgi:hypothetical protein